jgi:acyl-CoA thioesterase-1
VKRLFVVSSIGLWVLGLGALPAHAEAPVILVFGDSISAGYGLEHADQGWVGLLRTKLKDSGYETQVVNASVSGETTAGGLSRLPRALNQHHPQIVILELGGNDGLRALPVEQLRTNLERMVGLAQAAGARVLLLGIRIPPNYGPEYTDKFFAVYGQVAEAEKIPLVPFLLDGIALSPSLMQADGIHPNQAGQPRLLANIWPALEPLLPHPNR